MSQFRIPLKLSHCWQIKLKESIIENLNSVGEKRIFIKLVFVE